MVDKTLYISGQIGFDPKSMEIVSGGVEQEANQALINMGAILKSVGCSYKNVVKTTVLLNDIKDFTRVNDIYKKFFSSHEPARAAYQVIKKFLKIHFLFKVTRFSLLLFRLLHFQKEPKWKLKLLL